MPLASDTDSTTGTSRVVLLHFFHVNVRDVPYTLPAQNLQPSARQEQGLGLVGVQGQARHVDSVATLQREQGGFPTELGHEP